MADEDDFPHPGRAVFGCARLQWLFLTMAICGSLSSFRDNAHPPYSSREDKEDLLSLRKQRDERTSTSSFLDDDRFVVRNSYGFFRIRQKNSNRRHDCAGSTLSEVQGSRPICTLSASEETSPSYTFGFGADDTGSPRNTHRRVWAAPGHYHGWRIRFSLEPIGKDDEGNEVDHQSWRRIGSECLEDITTAW